MQTQCKPDVKSGGLHICKSLGSLSRDGNVTFRKTEAWREVTDFMHSWLGYLVIWKIPGATDLSCAIGVLVSSLDLIRLWLFFHAALIIFLLYDFPLHWLLPLLALGTGALCPTTVPCRWVPEVSLPVESEES